MGIATNTSVGVDYSMPTEQVCVLLEIHSLVVGKTLMCLFSIGVGLNLKIHTLSLWVLDWSHNNDCRFNLSTRERFCAAGDSRPIFSILIDKKILTICGLAIDSLTHINNSH